MALRSVRKGRRARPIAPGTEREAVNEPVVLVHNRGELAIEITNLAVQIDALAFECDRLPEAMRRVDLARTIMPQGGGRGRGCVAVSAQASSSLAHQAGWHAHAPRPYLVHVWIVGH